jgi:hypothetical protein
MDESMCGNDREDDNEWGWWEDRTIGGKILIVTGLVVLGLGLLFLCGWVVMLLWNWLMPDIFGLKRIGYWQGWGLLILSSILFRGKIGSSGNSKGKSDRRRKKQLRRYIREAMDKADEPGETTTEPGAKE